MDTRAFDYRTAIGREFGNVIIVKELGRGAMGAVFLGFQKSLKRQVAVKLLPKSLATTAKARQQFRDEAETIAILHHPNIVPIYDTGADDIFYYQVMQCIDGEDLGRIIGKQLKHPVPHKRLMPVTTSIRIMTDVLDGLGYAHEEGVIHQDMKPGNIMIENRRRRPLIVDFGIAKTAKMDFWAKGMIVGSSVYLSPEQAAARDTDHRTDIYSMGVVLFELLAGLLPLRREEDEKALLMRKIREPDTVFSKRPSECSPHINRSMEHIITRALASQPQDRYRDCHAFRDDLLQWIP